MRLNNYHKALIVIAVGIFFTNLPQYVYEARGFTKLDSPKHWVLMFCLLALPVFIRQMLRSNVLKSPVMIWCFGYGALSVLWFFLSAQSETSWAEVRMRFLAIIEIVAFLMVFCAPAATTLTRKALLAALVLAVAVNIYESFAPMSFSQVLGRSAGLYSNPNMSAEALVLGMVLSVSILKSQYRTPFVLLVGIGVFLTVSRGGILAWAVAVAGLLFTREISSKDVVRSGFIAFVLVVLVLLPRWDQLVGTWERTGVLNVNVMERLAWLTDPAGVSDHSSWERKYVAKQAWEKITEHPVLGTGTGSSYEAYTGTHNQYLALMIDHGIIGIVIVPLFILAVTRGARGQSRRIATVFGFTIIVLSFFSHTIFYTSYNLVMFSLMAAITATSRDGEGRLTVAMARPEPETTQVLAET